MKRCPTVPVAPRTATRRLRLTASSLTHDAAGLSRAYCRQPKRRRALRHPRVVRDDHVKVAGEGRGCREVDRVEASEGAALTDLGSVFEKLLVQYDEIDVSELRPGSRHRDVALRPHRAHCLDP